MIDWSKPLEFDNGFDRHPARLICTDRKSKANKTLTHIVLVTIDGGDHVQHVDVQGHGSSGSVRNKKEKKKVWTITYQYQVGAKSLFSTTEFSPTTIEDWNRRQENNASGAKALSVTEVEYEV